MFDLRDWHGVVTKYLHSDGELYRGRFIQDIARDVRLNKLVSRFYFEVLSNDNDFQVSGRVFDINRKDTIFVREKNYFMYRRRN